MKNWKIPVLALVLTLIPSLAFCADFGRSRLGYLAGDVQMQTADLQEWIPASINTPVREGDRIWVPEAGRAEIQILGGAFIRLDSFTSLDALALGEQSGQFFLNEGHAFVHNRGQGVNVIQIDTPISSVSCHGASAVMIDVAQGGETAVSVLMGNAYAETVNGKVKVPQGSTLIIRENLSAEFHPMTAGGEWENWNRERDRMLASGGDSLRYLPEELGDYAPDLDANGRWLNTSDYGYVWTPNVSLSADWAPYRNGRWAMMGGNYIWISYEPWGWAPHHYGRWAFQAGTGWCWVPPRHGTARWAPGYVGWAHTPTYVSWVPLAPGDTYYGHGNYGPGSVNINTINISFTDAHLRFRNINARNAVSVMHRDTFFHGRRTDFRPRENPFRQRNVGFGPPPVARPERTTVSPVIRNIPAAKLPPPQIQRVRPDKLRQERRLVTDERGSVFRPGAPIRQMPARRVEATGRQQQPPAHPAAQQTIRHGTPVSVRPQTERIPRTSAQPATTPPTAAPVLQQRRPTPPAVPSYTGTQPGRVERNETRKERIGSERTVVRPAETGRAPASERRPPVTAPSSPLRPSMSGQPDGRTQRPRIQQVPTQPAAQQPIRHGTPAQVRPQTERIPRTSAQPATTPPAPAPVLQQRRPTPPAAPSPGQSGGRVMEAPARTTQPGESTRPRIQVPTARQSVPRPTAEQPRIPAAAAPREQKPTGQAIQPRRYETPARGDQQQGGRMDRHQPSGDQPDTVQGHSQKPSVQRRTETRDQATPRPDESRQQRGGMDNPQKQFHGQGRDGSR